MKLCVVIVFFFTMLSCQKDTDEQVIPFSASQILGDWQLKSSYISSGGATEWKVVENEDILKFAIDGTFSQSNTFEGKFDKSGAFELSEGLLTLVYQEDDEEKNQKFSVKLGSSKMTLSPAGPVFCTEPCLSRYLKID